MSMVETVVRREPWEVGPRLVELQLGPIERLLRVHSVAIWRLDRSDGVEAIVNDALKIRVVFANVDIACNDELKPKPGSRKGAGAERVCVGNLFDSLPEFAPRQPDGWKTFYITVDPRGAA